MTLIATADTYILSTLYAARDAQWVVVNIWISEFGRATTVCLLAVAIALFLLMRGRAALTQGLGVAVATSYTGTFFLKGFIARARPPQEYWAYHEAWLSFPSAHAALALTLYGFVVFMAYNLRCNRATRISVTIGAVVLILAIGFSRVYLGVHYPSDVLAGYLLGGACLWLGMWATRLFTRSTSGNV